MINRTRSRPIALALRALFALAAATAVLAVVAGPAAAESEPPVDENGKKSCSMKVSIDGKPPVPTYFPHGSTTTVTDPKGGTAKLRCDDGTWQAEVVRSRFAVLTEWTVRADGLGLVSLLVAQ